MELAKYFRTKGNPIQAFYILENARRGRFEQEVFDAAFLRHFGGSAPLDNSKAAEEKYLSLLKASPDDLETLDHLADIYISRDDFAKAEPLLQRLLKRDPQDFATVAALATIYRRQNNPGKEKQILDSFEKKFPTAAGSYGIKIERTSKSHPEAAKMLLTEALTKYPTDGHFWYIMGRLAESGDKHEEAAAHYTKAAQLSPNSDVIQGMTGRFFRKIKDEEKALKYYLNAYFLDPHAHFDGHVEARISGLNIDLSKRRVETLIGAGTKLEDLLIDTNPMVVVLALQRLIEKWDGEDATLFIRLMRHDEVMVRWFAMQALAQKAVRKVDPQLKELLKESDHRVRGLAAYIAVQRWKKESFPEMRKMLGETSQILRFDAASALMMYGGTDGRQMVVEHRKRESHEGLKGIIDSISERDE
jgi:tetratricopeptide (TPR) repeat protein